MEMILGCLIIGALTFFTPLESDWVIGIFGQYRANSRHHDKSYNVARNPTDLLICMCVCVVTTKLSERNRRKIQK